MNKWRCMCEIEAGNDQKVCGMLLMLTNVSVG